jgi:hypothetical protein
VSISEAASQKYKSELQFSAKMLTQRRLNAEMHTLF